MPHVAKRDLLPKVRSELNEQLLKIFAEGSVRKITQELLTETERIMLAKRLAIILMLSEEFSYYRIAKTLDVSTSTIKRFHQQLIGGDFPALETIVHKRLENKAFWRSMEAILRAGLPPIGKGRWQNIDKIMRKMQ